MRETTAEDTYDAIIEQLKCERLRRGLTMQQLAESIGRKSYQSIWKWESRTQDPGISNLRRWAAALGYRILLAPLPPELKGRRHS